MVLLIVLSAVDGRRGITTLQPPSQKPVARQVFFFVFGNFLHDLPGLHTSASDITPSVSTDEADVLLRELRMTVLAHAQDSCFRSLGIGAHAVVDVVVAVKLVVIDNDVWSSQ